MLSESLDFIIDDAKETMDKAFKHLQHEFLQIRAGRANPAMVEELRADVYGSMMPLNQVASISAPAPDLIIIQPWDKTSLNAIEKAIMTSNMGFNPSNDGNIIRIPIPPLSGERRKELAKVAKVKAEDAKVAIRNIRRDANNDIKKTVGEEKLPEDMKFEGEAAVQKATDNFIAKIDDLLKRKETEITEV
jgi:ribosome recycling factor